MEGDKKNARGMMTRGESMRTGTKNGIFALF